MCNVKNALVEWVLSWAATEWVLGWAAREWLSAISALGAIAAAWFARGSSLQAKAANQIYLLQDRKEIINAFGDLKHHMEQKRCCAELDEVQKFFRPSEDSSLYFPELAKDIADYYSACFRIADIGRTYSGISTARTEECKSYVAIIDKLGPKIEQKIKASVKLK